MILCPWQGTAGRSPFFSSSTFTRLDSRFFFGPRLTADWTLATYRPHLRPSQASGIRLLLKLWTGRQILSTLRPRSDAGQHAWRAIDFSELDRRVRRPRRLFRARGKSCTAKMVTQSTTNTKSSRVCRRLFGHEDDIFGGTSRGVESSDPDPGTITQDDCRLQRRQGMDQARRRRRLRRFSLSHKSEVSIEIFGERA